MPEQQNIEYKQSWHDDYLKWICGFANAQGGVIFLGKDDYGKLIGLDNSKRLLDDIPNKIKNAMGISVEVNLQEEDGKTFIEIITPPYSVPISLRGRYYHRVGSTKQELVGTALTEFLLKKSGQTWDDLVEQRADFKDINTETVELFLRAAKNAGRLPDDLILSIPELFEKLRLAEKGKLKRAAVILFGKDPGRFYPNTFIKIGKFGENDTDLLFQTVEEGNLIQLLHASLNSLNHNFLLKSVQFEGIYRIERGEYPVAAIREMLLNALVHRNYMGAPIQIKVYDDKISIWNEGTLPLGLTLEALKRSHSSRPRNPIIADVCFKGGYIDAWGRGTIKIIDTCHEANLPTPQMCEIDGGFMISLSKYKTEEKLRKIGLNERQIKVYFLIKEKGAISNADYQKEFNVSKATATRDLTELADRFMFLEKKGSAGAGRTYSLKG